MEVRMSADKLTSRAFAHAFRLLCERFGRDAPSEDLTKAYYRELSVLTDDEFKAASKTIFREDDFFPTPARFLNLAGKGTDTNAREAWERIEAAARNGTLPNLEGPAHRALMSIGGIRAVEYTDETKGLPHVRRRYLEAYKGFVERDNRPEPLALDAPSPLRIQE